MGGANGSPRRPSVLVTGAAGYIGRLAVEALARRRDELGELVALDVRPPDELPAGVTPVTLSVTDPALHDVLEQHHVSHVVHLASVVRPPKDGGDRLAYEVDVEGTRNVLAGSVAAGVRKIVVTTSGAAYGYHADNPAWLSERDPIRGNVEFPYSYHKRLIESMLADYREAHPELHQLVFRPGTVIGTTVNSPVTDLFEKGAVIGVLGHPSPFVFIWDSDVVACLVEGVFTDKTGAYNLAGDGAMTPREIAERLGKPYLPLPAGLIRAALGLLHRLGKSPYGPEQVKFLSYRPVLSNHQLKESFGYVPQKTSREAFELYAASRD